MLSEIFKAELHCLNLACPFKTFKTLTDSKIKSSITQNILQLQEQLKFYQVMSANSENENFKTIFRNIKSSFCKEIKAT